MTNISFCKLNKSLRIFYKKCKESNKQQIMPKMSSGKYLCCEDTKILQLIGNITMCVYACGF